MERLLTTFFYPTEPGVYNFIYTFVYPTGCYGTTTFSINVLNIGINNCVDQPNISNNLEDNDDNILNTTEEQSESNLYVIAIVGAGLVIIALIILFIVRSKRIIDEEVLELSDANDSEEEKENSQNESDPEDRPALTRQLSKKLVREASVIAKSWRKNIIKEEEKSDNDSDEEENENKKQKGIKTKKNETDPEDRPVMTRQLSKKLVREASVIAKSWRKNIIKEEEKSDKESSKQSE